MLPWVDFKALRQQLNFKAVLQQYGVALRIRYNGTQHHGFCPLPTHQGKRRSPSFSANLSKGIWQCFGCGAKGTVIDFVAYMEGLDPTNGRQLLTIARQLQERLKSAVSHPNYTTLKPSAADEPPAIANAPLRFQLRGLNPNHSYLRQRGFESRTIAQFGLGYCSHGYFKGRIAIPLHDTIGRLVGYAGRLADDTAIDEEHPKYKFPPKRCVNGVVYELRKAVLLYNAHRIARPVEQLIVVEGFASVWWLWQAGYPNIVAIMGASCSDTQAALIVSLVSVDGPVIIMADGDAAGTRCATSIHDRLAPHRRTECLQLAPGTQPTDYTPADLVKLLGPPPS